MKLIYRSPLLIFTIATFFLTSCALNYSSEDEDLADKAVSLGYVAVAVDGFIRYGKPAPEMTGEELLIEATRQNPALLKPLADLFVTARREGTLSSVLLCDKNKERALAEDAGCTSARLDSRLWKKKPNAACAFQLDLTAVCPKN